MGVCVSAASLNLIIRTSKKKHQESLRHAYQHACKQGRAWEPHLAGVSGVCGCVNCAAPHPRAGAFGLWIRVPPGPVSVVAHFGCVCVRGARGLHLVHERVCRGGATRPGSVWPPGSSDFGRWASRDHVQLWHAPGGQICMLFLACVWARVGVVGDGLVSIETHNNSGDCFRSARVLVRLCLLDLEAVLLPVLTRFGAAGLGGVVSVFWVGRFGALNWCARACWLWCALLSRCWRVRVVGLRGGCDLRWVWRTGFSQQSGTPTAIKLAPSLTS